MKHLRFFMPAILAFAVTVSCGGNSGDDYTDEHNVSTNPVSIECDSAAGTYTFEVTADTSWQAYASDDCTSWVTGIEPAWSEASSGVVTFNISENYARTDRSGCIVIKCGTTRHKVEIVQVAAEEPSITCPIDGYSLVWHDEFDADEVSTSAWRFENWPWYYVNNELQYYVSGGKLGDQQTAYVQDGALCIKAQKANGSAKFNGTEDITGKVISARMNTKKSWKYGYFEASIWLPKGKGTWPAYWCMPDDQSLGWPKCGEIDIMEEVGVDANIVSSSIHTGSYNHVKGTQKTAAKTLSGAESGFHTYALEWTEDYIKTYVDGKLLFTFNNDKAGNNDTWPFNKTFYITLNLAWGGDWGGYAGVDESALPCTMKVDYVRVFQK
ncbi:MAG: family 16 glycosylhydrolase [Candidatus Cryptobacteroides sp.]